MQSASRYAEILLVLTLRTRDYRKKHNICCGVLLKLWCAALWAGARCPAARLRFTSIAEAQLSWPFLSRISDAVKHDPPSAIHPAI